MGEASPAGEPLAGTGDFPVGGGVVVKTASGPVVVTHPTDTEFLAFNGRCPHAGCPVAEVLENTILCNCHGSTFDGSTGDRLEGPAPTGLEPVPIQVAGGEIYLA
jgi:Rieske Fe-S protein